jgi:phosphoenolpyruvate carboxylase
VLLQVEVRGLKRKLTFSGVDVLVSELEHKLYRSVFSIQGEIYITLEVYSQLNKIKTIIIEHQSLYLDDLESLLIKVNLFGFILQLSTFSEQQNT